MLKMFENGFILYLSWYSWLRKDMYHSTYGAWEGLVIVGKLGIIGVVR